MLARLAKSLGRWASGGKARYLVGHDLAGNAYYEYPPYNEGGKTPSELSRGRRIVKYREHKSIEDYDQKDLPIQWKMWLRHTRRAAPSLEELQVDRQRMITLQDLVVNIEERDREMRMREQAKKLEAQQQRDRERDGIEAPAAQAAPASPSQPASTSRLPAKGRSRTPIGALTSEVADEGVVESRARRVPVSISKASTAAYTEEGRQHAGRVVEEREADEDVWQASRNRVRQQDRGGRVDSSGGRRSYSTMAVAHRRGYATGPVRPVSGVRSQRPQPTPPTPPGPPPNRQQGAFKASDGIPIPVYAAGAAAVGLALVAVWVMPNPWALKEGDIDASAISGPKAGGLLVTSWTPLKLLSSKVTTTTRDVDAVGDGLHKVLTLGLPSQQAQVPAVGTRDLAIYSLSVKQPDIQIERSYTPLETPERAASLGKLDLIIKRYDNGEMGRYLHSLRPGQDGVEVRGWLETWKPSSPAALEEIVMIVGGTGVAPAHQLLSARFGGEAPLPGPRIKLLYAANSPSSFLLLPELRDLRDRSEDFRTSVIPPTTTTKMAPAKSAGVPATVPADASALANSAGAQAAATHNTAEEQRAVKIEAARLLEANDQEAAQELVNLVKVDGPAAFFDCKIQDVVKKGLSDKKNAGAREGACTLVAKLCEQGVSHELEPYVVGDVFNTLIEAMGDKEKAVQAAAKNALVQYVKSMSGWSVAQNLKVILEQMRSAGKWQVKTGCVTLLETLVTSAPDRIAAHMPDIIPVMAEVIWDTKTDVQKASRGALTTICQLVSNKDIEKFIPALIQSLIHPVEEVPKTIQLLAATTFVQEVDSPTLALIAPLLARGINERPTATKRKVAVIIDNMAKLVDNERTVRPFLPKLLPGLIKMETTMADPEARGVVQRAIATLRSVGQVEGDGSDVKPLEDVDQKQSVELVKKETAAVKITGPAALVEYVGQLSTNLANARNFEATEWDSALVPYLSLFRGSDSEKSVKVARALLSSLAKSTGEEAEVFEDEEEGVDLCNCQFSLAYGAKILLNTATLRLKRGHRYGLCGRNGSGKSTLMRAIQNGQVEGFPSPDEVRTWYVEHDLDGSEGDISIVDFIVADKRLNVDHAEASKTLGEMGFSQQMQSSPIAALSGGWKMKLALARAVLFKADILLLDEPTNHLDVVNIAWITNYLTTMTDTTSIIVSHDSKFLNDVCTDILHLNRFKIKRYPGNLDAFVKRVPEAKAYAELNTGENYSFKLPDPPLLDGVKTKEKSLAKMRDVHFQYPNTPAPQLNGISMQLSLSSRVAILGPNGSGKSTLVKLIVGDTEPNSGEVWKHPNLVIGYVAQHAFHHIDHHLDKTPLDYMLWRYQTGEDLEEHLKSSRELSEAEKEAMKNGAIYVDEAGVKRIIDELVGRKKLKNSFQYEVSFKNFSSADNIWLSRDDLIKRGFEKKVMALDSREAQRLGMNRPLVRREIEKHFEDFGLEAEFTSHNTMRGLSGGQKVKVVLAAATWRRPHIIILDEPTNFLDRESLAALIQALKTYEGGVAIITHSREFSENVCQEIWAMDGGRLRASGHNWVEGQGQGKRIDGDQGEEKETFDQFGNKIVAAKKEKKQSAADKRKARKARMKGGAAEEDDLEDL
ncbi:unnamed protein product [Parajaminaea phylloscopi]